MGRDRTVMFALVAALAVPRPVAGCTCVQGSATRIVALGLGAGLVLAWMAGRGLQVVLPGVDALDVPSFAAALAVLGSVAYAAAFLPARRATRVDPVQVMREE